MKNTINFYDLKKTRPIQPAKKINCLSSIIYKEINGQLNEASGKIKHHREVKEAIAAK
jgi:hypothetical protein